MCRNPLLEYGAKALEDHKKGLCTYDVEQVVLAIVVTTGLPHFPDERFHPGL